MGTKKYILVLSILLCIPGILFFVWIGGTAVTDFSSIRDASLLLLQWLSLDPAADIFGIVMRFGSLFQVVLAATLATQLLRGTTRSVISVIISCASVIILDLLYVVYKQASFFNAQYLEYIVLLAPHLLVLGGWVFGRIYGGRQGHGATVAAGISILSILGASDALIVSGSVLIGALRGSMDALEVVAKGFAFSAALAIVSIPIACALFGLQRACGGLTGNGARGIVASFFASIGVSVSLLAVMTI